MRIIVTESGNGIIKDIHQEIHQQQEIKREKHKLRSLDRLSISPLLSPTKIKTIKINQAKISKKNIAENYKEDKKENNFNNQFKPNFIHLMENKFGQNSYSELPIIRESYTIKEIIPTKVFNNMERDLKFQLDIKNSIKKVDERYLRSPIMNSKQIIEDIENKASKKIKSEKLNLINYLNNKQKISDKFVKALASYDEKRLSKINQVCQTLSQSVEKEKVFNSIFANRILVERTKEFEDYKNTLDKIENDMRTEQQILKRNERQIDDKERYYWIHREMKDLWNKNNLDKLSSPKISPIRSNNFDDE